MPNFRDLKLNKVIFEIRYDRGYLYFDVCGATAKKIEEKMPDFKFRGIQEPNVAVLDNPEDRMVACFAWDKLDITQTVTGNVNKFQEAAETFSKIVFESLKVDKYNRVGNRYQFMYKADSLEDAERKIKKTWVIAKDWSKLGKLGGELKNFSCTAILRGEGEYFHRVVLSAVQRQRLAVFKTKLEEEYNPEFAVLIDVDVFQENPQSLNISDFIHKAYKKMEHNAIKLLG